MKWHCYSLCIIRNYRIQIRLCAYHQLKTDNVVAVYRASVHVKKTPLKEIEQQTHQLRRNLRLPKSFRKKSEKREVPVYYISTKEWEKMEVGRGEG